MYVCVLQSSMFLTRYLKKLYEFTVIPRYTLQLVPKKKSNVNRMTRQIELKEKNFFLRRKSKQL